MAEYHFPVPGAVDENKIVLFVHRHWASFLGQFFLSLVMLVAPGIIVLILFFSDIKIAEGFVTHFMVLGLSIYYLITITVAFLAWISYYYDIYIITEDAIIDISQQGFFGRKISQLSLLRVQDVTSNIVGFLPTFFGFGDVLVETAGEQSQNFLLKAVPNPQEVSAKIMELHNGLVETEGRHHQLLEAEGALAPGTIREGTHQVGDGHPMSETSPPVSQPAPPPPTNQPTFQQNIPSAPKEGEVSHDDLDKGGEIELK
jgi:membrane protein YdbS with pleckstrin-like domain